MKKVFFLVAFLFSVVCYAAPPPDNPAGFLTEDVGVFRSQVDMAFQSLEAQEVAYIYRGDSYAHVNESALTNDFLMLSDVEVREGIIMNWNCLTIFRGNCPNKQHSNYGYPFRGNYVL